MPPFLYKPFPGVLHLEFNCQLNLTRAFMRLQEFYESPLGDFRGRYFTRDEFKQAYAEDKGTGTGWGEFTYYTDWNGFNVPGHIVDQFLEIFDIDFMEKYLANAIRKHRSEDGQYYVIGTHSRSDSTTIDHELSHAFWYLDPMYRKRAQHMVDMELPIVFSAVADGALKKMGYHDDVLDDEITAYLSTSTLVDMVDVFDTEDIPWKCALKFQQHFNTYLENKIDEQE